MKKKYSISSHVCYPSTVQIETELSNNKIYSEVKSRGRKDDGRVVVRVREVVVYNFFNFSIVI